MPTHHAEAEVILGWGGVAWPHGHTGAQPANLFSVSRSKVKTGSRTEDEASRGSKRGCFCLHQVGMKWHTLTSESRFPNKTADRASLVAPWVRIRLPARGHGFYP